MKPIPFPPWVSYQCVCISTLRIKCYQLLFFLILLFKLIKIVQHFCSRIGPWFEFMLFSITLNIGKKTTIKNFNNAMYRCITSINHCGTSCAAACAGVEIWALGVVLWVECRGIRVRDKDSRRQLFSYQVLCTKYWLDKGEGCRPLYFHSSKKKNS